MNPRRVVKLAIDSLGLRPAVERGLLESGLLGERLQYLFRTRPDPSEAILLAGSGRSGTTWVSDLLCQVPGTQRIFEPLRQAARWQAPGTRPLFRSPYLRPEGEYTGWHALLRDVLTGRCRTYWTDPSRTSFFPDRYLIKEIRANLMLGYIHNHFGSRIIHVLRHPCAVVASRTRLKWRVDLDNLLQQEELVEDELAGLTGDIQRAKSEAVASHAIWWAVENRVARRQLRGRAHFRAYYERLVSEPEQSLGAMLSWLGLDSDPIDGEKIRRSSRTTWSGGRGHDGQHSVPALMSWKNQLSRDEQWVVLDWAYRLGVEDYGEEPLPVTT
jgi:hypothetical protein